MLSRKKRQEDSGIAWEASYAHDNRNGSAMIVNDATSTTPSNNKCYDSGWHSMTLQVSYSIEYQGFLL